MDTVETSELLPNPTLPNLVTGASTHPAGRSAALEELIDPLPGRGPYENLRPMRVPARLAGRSVHDFLAGLHTHLSEDDWKQALAADQIRLNDRPLSGTETLHAGDVLIHILPGTQEPEVNARIRILYEDDSIIVVNKPAPLPVHASGRFARNTLLYLLGRVYAPQKLRLVHRLDANTTGILILARSRKAAAQLHSQFKLNEVEKRYLARVIGTPVDDTFRSDAPLTNVPGPIGGRQVDPDGRSASTSFQVRERFSDGTSLLDVRPETGRTNQIRVHLWDLEIPILGDPLYLPHRKLGASQTLAISDPPLWLHAESIRLRHPDSGKIVEFTSEAGMAWFRPIFRSVKTLLR